MVKTDATALRYLNADCKRVLTAVEMGMKNHALVPCELIYAISRLKRGGAHKSLGELHKHKLVYHQSKPYDGYKLTYRGYDFLALNVLARRDVLASLGNKLGVGKESDVYIALSHSPEVPGAEPLPIDDTLSSRRSSRFSSSSSTRTSSGVSTRHPQVVVIKFHRLGRVSFRTVKQNRDYLLHRKSASWLYLSRLAALKEFAYMKVLYDHGFPVPKPIDVNRHCIVMELVKGYPLCQVRVMGSPSKVYAQCMDQLVRLAKCGLIHCDYNEFNIMVNDDEEITIIDFPQMVSTSHINAKFYFDRDVECIKVFFKRKFGFEASEWPVFDQVVTHHSQTASSSSKNDATTDDEITPLDLLVEASGFSKEEQRRFELLLDETAQDSDASDSSSSSDDESWVKKIHSPTQQDTELSLEDRVRKQLGIMDLTTTKGGDGESLALVPTLIDESKQTTTTSNSSKQPTSNSDTSSSSSSSSSESLPPSGKEKYSDRIGSRSKRRRIKKQKQRLDPEFVRTKVKRETQRKNRRRFKRNNNKNRNNRAVRDSIRDY